jgi:hypothetical protein
MKKILISGQSNADGWGPGGWGDNFADSRIRFWNNVNPLGASGTAFITPALGAAPFNTVSGLKHQNAGLWFSHRIAQEYSDDVRTVMVTKGGTAIKEWSRIDDGLSPVTDRMISEWAASGLGVADFFLWQHGEQDSLDGTTYAVYKARFDDMLSMLTAAGVIDINTRIIVGGVINLPSYNTSVLQPLVANTPGCYYADPTNITELYNAQHFGGQGLVRLGYDRYWNAVKASLTLPTLSDSVHSRGSTADGDWIKYDDGRMVIAATIELQFNSAVVLSRVWTYPQAFIAAPRIINDIADGAVGSPPVSFVFRTPTQIIGTPSRTQATLCIGIDAGNAQDFDADDVGLISVVALGRWK